MPPKLLSLAICLTFFTAIINAQKNQITSIGVQKFSSEKSEYSESAAQVRAIINEILSSKKHLTLLDRTLDDDVMKELDTQKNLEYLRGVTAKQGKAIGAMKLLAGTVTSISITENKVNTGGIPGLKSIPGGNVKTQTCNLKFSLTFLDVETGSTIDSKAFSIESSADVTVESRKLSQKTDALKNAVENSKKNINKEVDLWINRLFPPVISITSIDTRDKKGYPKTISITSESGIELTKGTTITVNEVTEVDVNGTRKTKKVKIASVKVLVMQGDFVSCEVKDGEDQLEDKWKNSRIELVFADKK